MRVSINFGILFTFTTNVIALMIDEKFIKQATESGHDCENFLVNSLTTRSKLSCAEKCASREDECFSFSHNLQTRKCRLFSNVISDVTTCVSSPNTIVYRRKVNNELWPRGSFGLMGTTTGCPAPTWSTGRITQDTEGSNVLSAVTNAVHLKGSITTSEITTEFCMKQGGAVTEQPSWPMGSYCILKSGDCPSGFSSGYITWDDEDVTNSNSAVGALPDGEFTNDLTTIFYCCRNDSSTTSPMVLPTAAPFVLLKKGATCQSVNGMSVVEEWVFWETEGTNNNDAYEGSYPSMERITPDIGIKLFYCYYS
ncbi:uncharacterized protein LOC127717902 [Mytilus californianus]|uniref:uncharacterized protein LOC127717902 n=1 Tax=Mytilus californianus TaxID=6549 RepID=UPI0022452E1C|nr:uncharacterized protein LOC127717902 [Mytilus californianus]